MGNLTGGYSFHSILSNKVHTFCHQQVYRYFIWTISVALNSFVLRENSLQRPLESLRLDCANLVRAFCQVPNLEGFFPRKQLYGNGKVANKSKSKSTRRVRCQTHLFSWDFRLSTVTKDWFCSKFYFFTVSLL